MPTEADQKEASRRRPLHSPWSLAILIAIMGGIALLPTSTSRIEGGHARLGFLTHILSPWVIEEEEADLDVKFSRYSSNATSIVPGRLFRNNDEKGSATIISKRQSRKYSTYERLWKGYKLPWWAHKVQHFRGFQPPKGNSICYVHVGKTAGSSIGCALGFRLHCKDDQQYLPGRLPKSATHAFHKDVYDCPDYSDYYLFVLRDPLARFRSAFVYGRPDRYGHGAEENHWDKIKQIYIDCPTFTTANELAATGLTEDGEASDECKQRARDLLRGTAKYEDHIYFNYQYYLEGIPHKSNILVVRTEHMEDDWNSVEMSLGGKPRTNIPFPHENSRPKESRDLILGDEERMLLCHELCVEIQTYKLLLRRALNINIDQYKISMMELKQSCPNEAMLKQCDFHTPNIMSKLIENRGYPHPPIMKKRRHE